MTAPRYTYATGYTSREAADEAITDLLAECEVSPCERPAVDTYRTNDGRRRYKITLLDMNA